MPAADEPNSSRRTLVLGGARSGKSAYAENLIGADARARYVATARLDPDDLDFAARVEAHRARRPTSWTTVHNADLATVLGGEPQPTLVDDIGGWITAELDVAQAWDRPRGTISGRADELVGAVEAFTDRLVLVSPEVGLAVIPETASGRLFRDEIGTLNQRLAAVCDDVFLVVAGLPLQLK